MPRKKITEELWEQLIQAYTAWDPSAPDAVPIADVIKPFGITKQTFYSELSRRGIPLKTAKGQASGPAFDAMLEALIASRIRCKLLERTLTEHGIPLP